MEFVGEKNVKRKLNGKIEIENPVFFLWIFDIKSWILE
jgi:hypothetical protein